MKSQQIGNVMPMMDQVMTKSNDNAVKNKETEKATQAYKKTEAKTNTKNHNASEQNEKDKKTELSNENLSKAIEQANKKIQVVNKEFEFSVHERTKKIVVKVKNSETDEIIREIPSEKILDMVANMYELAGMIMDEKR